MSWGSAGMPHFSCVQGGPTSVSLRLTRESRMGPWSQEVALLPRGPPASGCHHSLGHIAQPPRAAWRVRCRSRGPRGRPQWALELNPLGNAPKTRLLRMGSLMSAGRLETVTHTAIWERGQAEARMASLFTQLKTLVGGRYTAQEGQRQGRARPPKAGGNSSVRGCQEKPVDPQ